jgi:hypothetical protein
MNSGPLQSANYELLNKADIHLMALIARAGQAVNGGAQQTQ